MAPKSGTKDEVELGAFVTAFNAWVGAIPKEAADSISSGKKTIYAYKALDGAPMLSYTSGKDKDRYTSPQGCATVVFNSLSTKERYEIYTKIASKTGPAPDPAPIVKPAAKPAPINSPLTEPVSDPFYGAKPVTSEPVRATAAQPAKPASYSQPAPAKEPASPILFASAPAASAPTTAQKPVASRVADPAYVEPSRAHQPAAAIPATPVPDASALQADADRAEQNMEKLIACADYFRIDHELDPLQEPASLVAEYQRVLSLVNDKAGRIQQIARSEVPSALELSQEKPKAEDNIKKLDTAAKVLGIDYSGNLKAPSVYKDLLERVCQEAERISQFSSLVDREIAGLHPVREQVLQNAEAMMMLLPISYPVLVFYKNAFPELKEKIDPLLSRIEPINEIEILRQKVEAEHGDKEKAAANTKFLEQRYAFMSGLGTLLPQFVKTSRAIRRHIERGDYLRKLNRHIGDTKAYAQQLMIYQEAFTELGVDFRKDGEPSIVDLLYRIEDLNPTLRLIEKQARRIYKEMEDKDAFSLTLTERVQEGWHSMTGWFHTKLEARTSKTSAPPSGTTHAGYHRFSDALHSLKDKATDRWKKYRNPAPAQTVPAPQPVLLSEKTVAPAPAPKPAQKPLAPPVPDPTSVQLSAAPKPAGDPPAVPQPPQPAPVTMPAPPVKTTMPRPGAAADPVPAVPLQPATMAKPPAIPAVPMTVPGPVPAAQKIAPTKPAPAPEPVTKPVPVKDSSSTIPSPRPQLVFKASTTIDAKPPAVSQPEKPVPPKTPAPPIEPKIMKAVNPPKILAIPLKKPADDDEL